MKICSKFRYLVGCLVLSGAAASATTLTGSFTGDDQSFQYTWNLAQATTVTAATTSYAAGGFVPVVSLFNATTGAFVAVDGGDASCTNGRMKDGTTGLCNDAFLNTAVAAGSYKVVLTEFDNFPNGNFSDGFSEAGNGNFTSAACGTSGPFWETDLAPCVQRTGNYSLNLSTASTATPEPATVWLILPVLAIAAYRFRRVKTQAARIS